MVSFASSIPSSSVENLAATITGPKIYTSQLWDNVYAETAADLLLDDLHLRLDVGQNGWLDVVTVLGAGPLAATGDELCAIVLARLDVVENLVALEARDLGGS